MRQDPNIIMVGEIRDSETASLAINASLTGHLVLSTLHTNSAAHSIPRLLDMKVEPFLLVSTLTVVVAQRLVRRLGKERDEYLLSKDERAELAKHADLERVLTHLRDEKIITEKDSWDTVKFFRPKPTKDSPDGYGGRAVISEVLFMSKSIRDMVIAGKAADDLAAQARAEGMLSLVEDGIFQAARGLTTLEEVLRVANEGV
jgi:type II secretory ATPase GspE/PulE/Tfp pilus assembly ATPase PilB-like protein